MIEFLQFTVSGWVEFVIVALSAMYLYLLLVSVVSAFKPMLITHQYYNKSDEVKD